MNLDVRLPMGLLFVIIGAILIVHGFSADPEIFRAHSLGININVRWGIIIFGFGTIMLFLSRKKAE